MVRTIVALEETHVQCGNKDKPREHETRKGGPCESHLLVRQVRFADTSIIGDTTPRPIHAILIGINPLTFHVPLC